LQAAYSRIAPDVMSILERFAQLMVTEAHLTQVARNIPESV